MRLQSVTVTLLVVLLLLGITAPAFAQRVIVTPSTYSPAGFTTAVYPTTSTIGNATPNNIMTAAGMIYGLLVDAGINTAGVQVFANFFNGLAANVQVGTTAPIFSVPIQAGGTSNGTKTAEIIKYISDIGYPISTALSFNCTTTRATTAGGGAIGTQVPCFANIIFK